VAIKQKEIIAPNLSMLYGLASIDGFDGGILPLTSYSQLMRLILPENGVTTDGRLRENLTAIPAAQWLDLFSTRYLITDKVGDVWREGVFFDMQHPVILDEQVGVGYVPDYEATELWLVADNQPGEITIETAASTWHLIPELKEDNLYWIPFPQPAIPLSITLSPPLPLSSAPPLLSALSLVDSRDHTFQSLVPGNYRLIHSGDVKIYENLDVLPRAYLVANWQWQPDVAASVTAMQAENFVVGATSVLISNSAQENHFSEQLTGTAIIMQDEPERVVVQTNSPTDAVLVLSDAYYPGWQAAIDGEATAVYQTNAYFRGIILPAGQHEVVFNFAPDSLRIGRLISSIGLSLWLVLLVIVLVYQRRQR
jgi:hypothetical protein